MRDGILDGLHQVGLHHHAVIGERGRGVRELQDRERVVTLADAQADRLAVVPLLLRGLLVGLALPFGRGQDAARLALDVDARELAEAERRHEVVDRVHAEVVREHVVIRVVRDHDRAIHVDPALTVAHVVAERVVAQRERARVLEAPVRRAFAQFERGERHERLVRRADRIRAAQRPVEQRPVGRVVEGVPVLLVDAFDEQVRVEARRRHERQHVAGLRLDGHDRAAPSGECLLGHLLELDVDRQHEVVARRGRRARDRAHRASARGDFDFLEAGDAVQLRLVTLLDTDLADVVGAFVIVGVAPDVVLRAVAVVFLAHRLDALAIALRDAADIADHVRGRLAERILPEQACVHVHAGEAETLCGKARDFLVGEARADRQALEALAVVHELLEAGAIARRDLDHVGQIGDQVLERTTDLRRRDLQRVGGIVACEHHAVAVHDHAPVGHDGRERHAVFVGLQRVLVVAEDLEVDEAHGEQAEADQHEKRGRRHPQMKRLQLLLGILELGHAGGLGGARRAGGGPVRSGACRLGRRRAFVAPAAGC
ncbi:hypothetical protein PNO31109_04294 [Pandoraea nosoerga]|uniref:Uncharacterized protein n=1 Tax=Pandoraea nosoerga TaxID=2508296 RepID=A0A5E4Y5L3_9BURK|nr:hypothetical protein PNO31109_04294 [Pandoraea nosoerga]